MFTERETVTLFTRFMLLICTAMIAICGSVRAPEAPSVSPFSSVAKSRCSLVGRFQSSSGEGGFYLWGLHRDGPSRSSTALSRAEVQP